MNCRLIGKSPRFELGKYMFEPYRFNITNIVKLIQINLSITNIVKLIQI